MTAPPTTRLPSTFADARIPSWQPALLAVLGVATLIICWATRPPDTAPVAGVEMNLPEHVGVWWGEDTKVSEAELRILPEDTTFARKTYNDGMGDEVLCSIVLSGAEARSIHRPERCLPGQGWTIGGSTTLPVTLSNGRVLEVQALDLSREQKIAEDKTITLRTIYIYWFVGDAYATPSNLDRVIRGSWDRVFLNRQHRWAYAIVSSPVTKNMQVLGKDRDQTLKMLEGFIAEMAPHMLTQRTLDALPKATP